MIIKDRIKLLLRRNGKIDFISKLNYDSLILDVGCGNNSPFHVKNILPHCTYTGLDIGDYNQTKPLLADLYLITTPEKFSDEIRKHSGVFDAVISSHNLEHCYNRQETLEAMLSSLKIGGEIFISFPCEKSIFFPSRVGTLNYFDDSTHKNSPPNFNETINIIKSNGFLIKYAEKNYSPKILRVIGFLMEPFSRISKKIMIGTWEYYGFESIIIAKKIY